MCVRVSDKAVDSSTMSNVNVRTRDKEGFERGTCMNPYAVRRAYPKDKVGEASEQRAMNSERSQALIS